MSNFDFINDLSESSTINNNDYAIVDIFDNSSGSYVTRKITFSNYIDQIKSFINTTFPFNINTLENNVTNIEISLSSKLDKNGLLYNINEKITGPLVLNSTLSVFENTDFNNYINLRYNLINNLSVISPIDSYDLINKKYVDDHIIEINNSLINPNNYVSRNGSTMTGSLCLHSNPTDLYHTSTKQYVDTLFNELSNYVHLSGFDSITNHVSVIEPIDNSHIVTKKYADQNNNSKDFLLLSGGELTGSIIIPSLSSNSLNYIADRDYVIKANTITKTNYLSVGGGFLFTNPISVLTPNVSSEIANKYYVDLTINHDKFVKITGDLMTGALSAFYPISANHIVIKEYVDNIANYLSSTYVKISGYDTITGTLSVLVEPTLSNQVATLLYADTRNNTGNYIQTTGGALSVINRKGGELSVQPLNYQLQNPKLIADKQYIDTAYDIIINSLRIEGGKLTGPLGVLIPNTRVEIANKAYVDEILKPPTIFITKDAPIVLPGELIIENDPNADQEIANKQYVDSLANNANTNYVHLSGNETITGKLYINSYPTASKQILHKQAVDTINSSLSTLLPKNQDAVITGPINLTVPNITSPIKLGEDPTIIIPKSYADLLEKEAKKFLRYTGGTITPGNLTVLSAISANHIVTKKSIDDTFKPNLSVPIAGNVKITNYLSAFSDPNTSKEIATKQYAEKIADADNYTKLKDTAINKTSFKRHAQGYKLLTSSSTLTLNASACTVFQINVTSSINGFTIQNINPNKVYYFTFFLNQKTNNSTINWNINSKNVLWASQGDEKPSFTNVINTSDVVTIIAINGEFYGIDGGQQYV
jgi:hypothetical protein